MLDRGSIRRDLMMIFAGAAIGVLFGILVAYPQVLARSSENEARIESNKDQIELLWDAHQIQHVTPTAGGG